jgi:hypothetical protein
MIVLQGVLQRRAIALAIAQQYYRRPQREQWVHLLDQGDMQVFGTGPLLALAYLPGQRQGTSFVDDVHHQRHTPAPHDAAIEEQHHRLQDEMPKQDLRIRNNINVLRDMVVLHPPGKAFDAALGLRAIRHLGSNVGQVCPLTSDDAAHQRSQGHQVPGDRPCRLVRRPLV